MGIKEWLEERRANYNIEAFVVEPRANTQDPDKPTLRLRKTMARRKVTADGECTYILKDDIKNPLIPRRYDFLYTLEDGRNMLLLYNPDYGDYFSLKLGNIALTETKERAENGELILVKTGISNLEVVAEDTKSWMVTSKKQMELRYAYKTNWEAAIPIISLFIALIALGIFWKITSGDAQKLAETLKSIGDSVAQSAANLQTCSSVPPAPPG